MAWLCALNWFLVLEAFLRISKRFLQRNFKSIKTRKDFNQFRFVFNTMETTFSRKDHEYSRDFRQRTWLFYIQGVYFLFLLRQETEIWGKFFRHSQRIIKKVGDTFYTYSNIHEWLQLYQRDVFQEFCCKLLSWPCRMCCKISTFFMKVFHHSKLKGLIPLLTNGGSWYLTKFKW